MEDLPLESQWVTLSKPLAIVACIFMALFYVAVLYTPTLILRLPPPESFQHLMIRRFACSAVSTLTSILLVTFLLPITVGSVDVAELFSIFGIRLDHLWEATVFPLLLTSTVYAGSVGLKLNSLFNLFKEHAGKDGSSFWLFIQGICAVNVEIEHSTSHNILAWRNYIVAPLTEELVFRACMISLLLCGGFGVHSVIFLSPVLFSLAHLNHWTEAYVRSKYRLLKTLMVVGLQLGYTVIFGSYASFLYLRTGHLLSPFAAHVFCNFMGLPVIYAGRKGILFVSLAGLGAFFGLLVSFTRPSLFNDMTLKCHCWHGYCSWTSALYCN